MGMWVYSLYYARPRLVISSCLGVKPVRYDGNIIFDQHVERLKKYVDVVDVCPELGIGLTVPRNPLALNKVDGDVRLLDVVTGVDYTNAVISFTIDYVSKLPDVDGFILKSASPSCGVGDSKIYDRSRRIVGRVDGLFTRTVRSTLQYVPIESEKRLLDHVLRRNFYTVIFTLAYVREFLERVVEPDEVVDLHRTLKYLLMLYHPGILKRLGRLVAERSKVGLNELKREYKLGVMKALTRRPTSRSYASVFMHIYGHMREHLNPSERKYVLKLVEDLIKGREDVRTIITYFRGFIHRFSSEYLAEQRFLQPYPEDLDHALSPQT